MLEAHAGSEPYGKNQSVALDNGGVTVREALAFEALRDVRVLAGRSQLDNRVTGINIIEVPEVTRWLRGGELLFTALFAIKDNPQAQIRLLRELAKKGVAALAVKPGQYVPEVPAHIVEEAEAVGLPLLELPPDIPYMDIARPILDVITNNRIKGLQAIESIRDQFLELLVSSSSLEPLCASICHTILHPVVVFDPDLQILASASPGEPDDTGWTEELEALAAAAAQHPTQAEGAPIRYSAPGGERSVNLLPITINAGTCGYLGIIVQGSRPFDPYVSLVLEQAARVLRLEFARERALVGKSQQLQASLLEELLIGRPQLRELSSQKARMLGVDLKEDYVALVVRVSGLADAGFAAVLEKRMQQACRVALGERTRLILSRLDSEHTAGIVNCKPGHQANHLLSALSRTVDELSARFPKIDIVLGASRLWRCPEDFRHGYEEALRVVELHGTVVHTRVASFARLGVYQLLNELVGSPALREFYNETISLLVAYDSEHNRELCATAEAFFDCGMNLRKTADILHVHRNTLVYRLKRIEEITGHSLGDPEDSFELHLALRIRRLAAYQKQE